MPSLVPSPPGCLGSTLQRGFVVARCLEEAGSALPPRRVAVIAATLEWPQSSSPRVVNLAPTLLLRTAWSEQQPGDLGKRTWGELLEFHFLSQRLVCLPGFTVHGPLNSNPPPPMQGHRFGGCSLFRGGTWGSKTGRFGEHARDLQVDSGVLRRES